MNKHALTVITLFGIILLFGPHQRAAAQNAQPTPPKGYEPGLIARAYLGGDTNAKKYPTHCVAVVNTGKEFIDKYKPIAEDQIRGKAHTNEVFYCAFGYIVLEQEADVKFDMGDGTCFVNDKEFGRKTFTHHFKAGKYPVEITRSWGKGQGDFRIVNATTNAPVLFHTSQMLTRELGRSFKIGGRTMKSVDLAKPTSDPNRR
jgi:hypothetical protein